MKHRYKILLILILSIGGYAYFEIINPLKSEPRNFDHAKQYVMKVYKGNEKTFYCGCDYNYTIGTSAQVDLNGCGYEIRPASGQSKPSEGTITRASRVEYEHIFPASWFGSSLSCWNEGGRSNCSSNDDLFKFMESDIVNLTPSIGQVNGDRSNYWFSEFNYQSRPQYGNCDFTVNFKQSLVQPRKEVRGEIARVLLYMHDGYGVHMRPEQEKLLLRWHETYPVSEWEVERDERIRSLIGRGNPYVKGDMEWYIGKEPSGFMIEYYESQKEKGYSFSFNKDDFDKIINKVKRFL